MTTTTTRFESLSAIRSRRGNNWDGSLFSSGNKAPNMEATDLPALEWAQMFTSVAVLRDLASAQGDERTMNALLRKFGASQYVGDSVAQADLVRVASCINYEQLDSLRKSGVLIEE
jgi:hypothetical protein